MSLLIFAAIVLILLILAVFIIERAPIGQPWLKWALEAVAVLIAVVAIAQKAGIA